MKIILSQDVQNVGRKNEIKEVRDGYARNFLIPQRIAVPATDSALKALAAQKVRREREKSDEYLRYEASVEKLKLTTLRFKMKLGEKGKAFGSITAVKIRDALKKEGIETEKDWILLDEPIKTTGESVVALKFPQDLRAEVKISVEVE